MYLKVITPPTDTSPSWTILIDGIAECRYFAAELTPEEFEDNWAGHEVFFSSDDPWAGLDGDVKAHVAAIIYTLAADKSSHCMLFDHKAMLCNENGKAVEHFSAF